jgi:hypothetical protein
VAGIVVLMAGQHVLSGIRVGNGWPHRRTSESVPAVALTVNPHVANNGQFPLAIRNDISKSAGGKDLLDD